MAKKTCYGCGRCGYKTIHMLDKCPTCGVALEKLCCNCNEALGNCQCKKC